MNGKPAIYVALSQFCEDDQTPRQKLMEAGFDVRLNTTGRRIKRDELIEVLKGVDGVLAGVEPYDADILAQAPRLRCISRCGIGTDAIDLAEAKRRNISVLVTADEIVKPVAELTVAMMLALAKNIGLHSADLKSGEWKKHTGRMMSELTVGLMGFGKIARAVNQMLLPFHPRVLIHDPFVSTSLLPENVKSTSMDQLLAESDFLSIHAARKPQDGYLIGQKELSSMKKGSFLVNTARGYMLDENALLEALQSKHLAGAAMDVFETEPYNGPLGKLANVICTPHVATLTKSSRIAMEIKSVDNLVNFFKNARLETLS